MKKKNSVHGYIQKIYITKGDNLYNSSDHTADKMIALQIDGQLYWLESAFTYIEDLDDILQPLGVAVMGKKWGAIDNNGRALISNNFTRINKHHDDITNSNSSYSKRTVRTEDGRRWWQVADIAKKFSNRSGDARIVLAQ